MGILIRVLIQKNVKLELAVADWKEIGKTDRGRGWTDGQHRDWQRYDTNSQNDTAAGMMDRSSGINQSKIRDKQDKPLNE